MDTTLDVPNLTSHEQARIVHALGCVDSGTKSIFLTKIFGCQNCPFIGTQICPHEIKEGKSHTNGICSFRLKQLQELYDAANSVPRLFQQDAIVKSQILLDYFRDEFAKKGELHPNFHQLERNLHNLLDKTRRQDEGIKIHGEITVTHDKLRQIIDLQQESSEKTIEGELIAQTNKQQVKNASIFRDREDTELQART